ncbi:hypothetical protein I6N95_07740 [Vagococcus sp. BWB3-3]|uniref:Uncharacterized protein n=1 Tax=Vagococcus allomyrinae TaxID=2794353 RepID=A0A940P3K8_9ENTE|nr:hypothetical protein [Vagococcus allomyrinae]MBP1040894.1 hypothetical protein [Vagococcus allomyrinae]
MTIEGLYYIDIIYNLILFGICAIVVYFILKLAIKHGINESNIGIKTAESEIINDKKDEQSPS